MLAAKQIMPGALDKMRPQLLPENQVACDIWNELGGLDWNGLPILVELYDINDVEGLITRLVMIRNHLK